LEANSLSRTKPWEERGMSRAQWYREQTRARHETGMVPIKLTTVGTGPVSRSKVRGERKGDSRLEGIGRKGSRVA
jgi:hypothetical protein